jgi:DNA mismatch repair protein MutL
MPIQRLSELVIAQIAAGEVVERPASVVKELTENALDAGATNIQVSVAGGGRQLLRISDNGYGINAAEVEIAFARNATSKLQTAEDLITIATLGFRGEALCSIAAVAHVTCVTRHASETHGTKLVIEGGTIVSRQSVGAPAGTVITVENLFYNVPARLKFLKKDATERRLIAQIVMQMAMAYPAVRFVLEQDGREAFRSPGSGKLEDVLVAAYGVEEASNMAPVDGATNGIHVSGFTSSPELWRNDRTRIMLFVNGRIVQDSSLAHAVSQAYQGVLQQGQHPVAALMVRLPAEDVDVNVHPTKAEVRFRDPSRVFTAVQRAVREAINRPFDLPTEGARPDGPRIIGGILPTRPAHQQTLALTGESDTVAPNIARVAPDIPQAEEDDFSHVPEGAGLPENPRTLPVLRVVGQVGASYIIAEGPAGMYLIDQHGAHARVLYSQVKAHLAAGTLRQATDLPGATVLNAAQAKLLEQALPLLATLGIDLETFGPNTYRVAAAPSMTEGFDADSIINTILGELRADDPQDAALRGLCRLAAVKAGQVLDHNQMQALVRQLERTPEPFSSPDGTPTLVHLSSEQLKREFRRS